MLLVSVMCCPEGLRLNGFAGAAHKAHEYNRSMHATHHSLEFQCSIHIEFAGKASDWRVCNYSSFGGCSIMPL